LIGGHVKYHTKILCCLAIANFFITAHAKSQTMLSEVHENMVGFTRPFSCGNVNPGILALAKSEHLAFHIQPSPYGIKEFTRYGLCGDIPLGTSLFQIHPKTEYMHFDGFTSLQANMSIVWEGHDLPMFAGVLFKSEFATLEEGILHCLQVSTGIGGIVEIDEIARIGFALQMPIAFPASERVRDIHANLFSLGFGLEPISRFAVDIDMMFTAHGTGLRPKITHEMIQGTEIHAGLSSLHRSMIFGFSTMADSFLFNIDASLHLNLGFSWQFSLLYIP